MSIRKSLAATAVTGAMVIGIIAGAAPADAATSDIGTVTISTTTYYTGGGTEGEERELAFEAASAEAAGNYISVDAAKTGQTVLGIGGAMTEAAAYNISLLTEEQQEEIYEAYYGESGAKYSLTRSSMGSADFSLSGYSYCDTEGNKADPELKNFSIEKDYDYIIPGLQNILAKNPDVKFFAAPWSPPAWMKKGGKRSGGTAIGGLWSSVIKNDCVLEKYYEAYANYFVKYCQAYAEAGIPVYALSMQNESQNRPAWECCTWTSAQAAKFIGSYLGPALEANNIDTQLLIWDWDKGNDPLHREGMKKFCQRVLSDSKASKYIDGVAFHWYAGDLQHLIKGTPMWSEDFDSLDTIKEKYPNIHLYGTEACQEMGPWFGEIEPARRYTHDILTDFEHGAESFIDWNLVLNKDGGPTHDVTNQCHAPIMLDADNNIVYQPSYYVMKSISRTLQPGRVHVDSTSNVNLDKTAVLDEDGNVCLLVGNTSDTAVRAFVGDGSRRVQVEFPAHSISTITFPAN